MELFLTTLRILVWRNINVCCFRFYTSRLASCIWRSIAMTGLISYDFFVILIFFHSKKKQKSGHNMLFSFQCYKLIFLSMLQKKSAVQLLQNSCNALRIYRSATRLIRKKKIAFSKTASGMDKWTEIDWSSYCSNLENGLVSLRITAA